MEQEDPNVMQPERPVAAAQPPRIVKETVARHYANCAMIMTSPADLSVYFGRYQPITGPGGEHALAEVYETEVTMNFEQAWKLCSALVQTLRTLAAGRTQGAAHAAEGVHSDAAVTTLGDPGPASENSLSDLEIELPPEFCPQAGQSTEKRVSAPSVDCATGPATPGYPA